jgi:hypothetical protein
MAHGFTQINTDKNNFQKICVHPCSSVSKILVLFVEDLPYEDV